MSVLLKSILKGWRIKTLEVLDVGSRKMEK